MAIGELIDRVIAPFAPRTAAKRIAGRSSLALLRQFDAATPSRRTRNWSRPLTDADAESWRARSKLRASGHDLVRNNKYIAAGRSAPGRGHDRRRHRAALFCTPNPPLRQKAQDEWKRWAEDRRSTAT
jgi:hypothetical protein